MNAEEVKIERGVPIPKKRNIGCKYPIAFMKVGDSFVVDVPLRQGMSHLFKRHGMKCTTSLVEDGTKVRVWRTE